MKKLFASLVLLVMITATACADGLVNFIPTISNAVFPDCSGDYFYKNSTPEVRATMAIVMLLDYCDEVNRGDIDSIDYYNDTYFGYNGSILHVFFHDAAAQEAIYMMYSPDLGVASYHVVGRTDYDSYVQFMMGDLCTEYEHFTRNTMVLGEAAFLKWFDSLDD